ncbi:MAG: bifunctional [glutamine synthetase] adenylyltransferase/[glutamine synthetase]-adenylyl-L-tyrosine phosphorylase, partial [Hyphomicrobium sp.]
KHVRTFKNEVALLVALCDLGSVWPVMTVTRILSLTADAALQSALDFLLRCAEKRGELHLVDPQNPSLRSGYFILGMGKYGAFELNYSSDIDLIIFYDLEKTPLHKGVEPSPFFVRLSRDLVRLMDERTRDGYVFRTDLRLRPDAGATQIALSTDSAMVYYESFGQNWERAALIKARVVAGDIEAGENFLNALSPFIWRRYLDYAAIADIHAMKRQIHTFRGLGGIAVAGHNVKLGPGGIREIEFFTQTQQLIAGGRQKDLRVSATLEALTCLEKANWIKDSVREDLTKAYSELRRIEHRLQMVGDDQTHELPDDTTDLENFSRFAGFSQSSEFEANYLSTLECVRRHYGELFENAPKLTHEDVNMVFAGEEDDPETVAHLSRIGFSQPSQVIATIRGWHHGRYPAVRSPRARELLTEVQMGLITALAETSDPDAAFMSFDRFLSSLPAGVQLFSLLRANPGLLRLVTDIMGTAPRLARVLAKRARLLDAVIDPQVLGKLPSENEIKSLISQTLTHKGSDFQETLDQARVLASEQTFLVGLNILSGNISSNQAGTAYALVAECLIKALHAKVDEQLKQAHGPVAGGQSIILGMGKLGGKEMTAASDLDLIVIYDFDTKISQTEGARPLPPSQYYSRLTQRLITALSAPTAEGTLYEVDMRLRPSGQKGPVATQISSFIDYQFKEAWTWEHLALTRARVVSGSQQLTQKVEETIRSILIMQRDRKKIASDVHEMRQRIAKEKGTDNIWDLKQVRGGLVDLEFIAQYLQLIHAHQSPQILDTNTLHSFQKLHDANYLGNEAYEKLTQATRLTHDLMQITRLCQDEQFNPSTAPKGLRELAARAGDTPSFEALELKLQSTLKNVYDLYEFLIV